MKRRYSTPEIYRGKVDKNLPQAEQKKRLLANQWYVYYNFDGKQKKEKRGINREKTFDKKEIKAQSVRLSIEMDLENGYNPFNKLEYLPSMAKKEINLKDSIEKYKNDLILVNGLTKKSVSTYNSKLQALSRFLPNIQVKDIKTKDLEDFVKSKIEDQTFSQGSVKSTKRAFSAFFNWLINEDYIEKNPYLDFNKKIRSNKEVNEQHTPYSIEDFKKVMEYLDQNDRYTAFVCRMIYWTCIRPGELRQIQLKDIDLDNNRIILRKGVQKNKVKDSNESRFLHHDMADHIRKLNIHKYPSNYYLIGSTTNIIGEKMVGSGTPYHKLKTALERIDKIELAKNPNLDIKCLFKNKGYDLYGFKHTSNIARFKFHKWPLDAIKDINGHTSLETTLIYLRKLGLYTEIRNLPMSELFEGIQG